MLMRFCSDEIDQISQAYMEGASMREIALQMRASPTTIKNVLVGRDVSFRSVAETATLTYSRSIPITQSLLETIEGELLGDGSIRHYRHISSFVFSSKHKEYAQWLSNFFIREKVELGRSGVYPVVWFDERIQKTCIRFSFYTRGTSEFRAIGDRWYRNGTKIVPPDLHLSKTSLLHWWLGDGSRDKYDGFGRLCTDAFEEHEVYFLSSLLNDLVAIESTVILRKNPNGTEVLRIYIPRLDLDKMLSFLGSAPLACLAHRWGIQEVC